MATVPSWHERQCLEEFLGCSGVRSIVGLLYNV